MYKKGFTLVELAIVLVVIGLLTSGVLIGKSLIGAAKINREVSKLTQCSIAFVNFRQKFHQEAGDSNLFSPAGNNDGYLSGGVGSYCPARAGEGILVWAHLTQAGMLGNEKYTWPTSTDCAAFPSYVGITPISKVSAVAYPSSGYPEGIGLAPYWYAFDPIGWPRMKGTVVIGSFHRVIWTYYAPEIVWGLENKFDDGVPTRSREGLVRSWPILSVHSDGSGCTPENVEASVAANGEDARYCYTEIRFAPTLETPLVPK